MTAPSRRKRGIGSRDWSPSTARKCRPPTTPFVRPICLSRTTGRRWSSLGNSLIPHDKDSKEPGDQLPESRFQFDFMLRNPPFGVTWGGKDGYETEARKLKKTRYQAGMPRTNDGALLFLQTMLAKMQAAR